MCKIKAAGVLVDILNIMSSSEHVDSLKRLCDMSSLNINSDDCIISIIQKWKSEISDECT